MQLTDDQLVALQKFRTFLASGDQEFALVGYAGTGKSFLTQIIINEELAGQSVIAAAPSHKAKEVLSRFTGAPVVTVSALSGERMASREAEAEKEEFVRVTKGKLEPGHGFVLIDEISMVRREQYEWIRDTAFSLGARVIVIGDPAQLRPVRGKAVHVGSKTFPHHGVLREVVRSGDRLAQVGLAVRNGIPWDRASVTEVPDLGQDFLSRIRPVDGEITDVMLAHTNAEVQRIQQLACLNLYGHSKDEVRPGQWLRAENSGVVSNAELFQVSDVGPDTNEWGDQIWHAEVVGGDIYTLVPFARKDEVLQEALAAREEYGKVDFRTSLAWKHYYYLIQRCQLFTHPYAMTIHKAQGSTFQRVWTDLYELQRDRSLAYVAATRASDELIIKELTA